MKNKCPLCGMSNPMTQWLCMDCGAQLPNYGRRDINAPLYEQKPRVTRVKQNIPKPVAPSSNPRRPAPTPFFDAPEIVEDGPGLNISWSWVCGVLFFVFILLPWSCDSLLGPNAPEPDSESLGWATSIPATPERTPELPTPEPTDSKEVWVNSDSNIYHYPGSRWYGNTKDGYFSSLAAAKAGGARASQNGQ